MNHFKAVPHTPNHDLRQLRRLAWSIVLNAAGKSSKTNAVGSPCDSERWISFLICRLPNCSHYIQNSQPGSTSLPKRIHPYTSSRNTRRSTPKLKFLHTPTFDCKVHKSIKLFSNSFSHYAPVLWNSFPFQIRNSPSVTSFRKHLKTHLFNSSFPA